jgi:hypothetical protein
MKQTELAQMSGISKSYLSMILSGQRKPNPELASRMKEYDSRLPVKSRYRFGPCTQEVRGSIPLSSRYKQSVRGGATEGAESLAKYAGRFAYVVPESLPRLRWTHCRNILVVSRGSIS